ncbi:MAG: tRNA (adenosine(37)-N6)-dimethylallyltransferase MiaA [Candidatus Omnitrophota bacterium]
MRKHIIFLVGPTAVGKTETALLLADAIDAEIISCDSMQIYTGMDIGTQKPSREQRAAVRHHLIDILAPDQEFSAADFRERSLAIIARLQRASKIPLFVGGTGLYVSALVDGLFPSPPKDEALRNALYREQEIAGGDHLWRKLAAVDPETARLIHANDSKKLVRALEIYETTLTKKSELLSKTQRLPAAFPVKIFALTRPRQELYRRIDERVIGMFDEGFIEEVRRLPREKLGTTASQAIGYREVFAYLDGRLGLGEAQELIQKNTRHYAKRQLTWFRRDKRIEWVEIGSDERPAETAARIQERIRAFFGNK